MYPDHGEPGPAEPMPINEGDDRDIPVEVNDDEEVEEDG